jgi:2-octaprenyl-6-methoxyphenol hydroxylase
VGQTASLVGGPAPSFRRRRRGQSRLRDAAALASCRAPARGGYRRLRHITQRARWWADHLVDLLNRSLLSDFLPVQALRGLGLHLLANVGPLRRLVMQGGMGAPGNLPRLMQPGGLTRLSP